MPTTSAVTVHHVLVADAVSEAGLDVLRERPGFEVAVRTGDTLAAARQAMTRRPPHVLITTPESLYILLTSERFRPALTGVRFVIVDEVHALMGNKRGAHLALSLERLQALVDGAAPGARPQRIGCSATVSPVEDALAFLTGATARDPVLIDAGFSCREIGGRHQPFPGRTVWHRLNESHTSPARRPQRSEVSSTGSGSPRPGTTSPLQFGVSRADHPPTGGPSGGGCSPSQNANPSLADIARPNQ